MSGIVMALPRSLQSATRATQLASSSRSHIASRGHSTTSLGSNNGLSSQPTPSPKADTLSWSRYLQLRAQRRKVRNFISVPTTILAGSAAFPSLMLQEVNPANLVFGLEPVTVAIIGTVASMGMGWLAGPSIGDIIWAAYHRKDKEAFEAKDLQFFEHIKRNRVDASMAAIQNQLPDHYGENIGSIPDYRDWLRKQNEFRRKRAHGVVEDEKTI